jgi:hypothetical protein
MDGGCVKGLIKGAMIGKEGRFSITDKFVSYDTN